MTRTFTRTMMISNLANAEVKVVIYENNKYTSRTLGEMKEVKYTGLKSWSIVDGDDAKFIEMATDESVRDENHEYLVLEFEDKSRATFRNSYCDLFINGLI
jgi:hypothetical protein